MNDWTVIKDHPPMKYMKRPTFTIASDDWVTFVDDIFISEQKAKRVAIALNKLEKRYA